MGFFKQNVFSLFQLRKRLKIIIYAVHCLLDSWHIFSLLMKLFAKQSPQTLKFWLFQDFYFLSFVWREDDVNRYLQNVDSFSLHIVSQSSMTFLSLLTWLIVHNLLLIGKVKRQSQANLGFLPRAYNAVIWRKKERTIDFFPMIKGNKVPKGLYQLRWSSHRLWRVV